MKKRTKTGKATTTKNKEQKTGKKSGKKSRGKT